MDTVSNLINPHSYSGYSSSNYPGNAPSLANSLSGHIKISDKSSQRMDRVVFSPEAGRIAEEQGRQSVTNSEDTPLSLSKKGTTSELKAEELLEVQKLRQRDTEVKTHEQAHLASAGQYAAGGPSFSYEVGPDGKRYAVGGEVPIDISKESTPGETLVKMQIVARAALAPLNPSAADRRIATRAATISAQARQEIQLEARTPSSSPNQSLPDKEEIEQSPIPDSPLPDGQESPATNSPIASTSRHMVLKAYRAQAN